MKNMWSAFKYQLTFKLDFISKALGFVSLFGLMFRSELVTLSISVHFINKIFGVFLKWLKVVAQFW